MKSDFARGKFEIEYSVVELGFVEFELSSWRIIRLRSRGGNCIVSEPSYERAWSPYSCEHDSDEFFSFSPDACFEPTFGNSTIRGNTNIQIRKTKTFTTIAVLVVATVATYACCLQHMCALETWFVCSCSTSFSVFILSPRVCWHFSCRMWARGKLGKNTQTYPTETGRNILSSRLVREVNHRMASDQANVVWMFRDAYFFLIPILPPSRCNRLKSIINLVNCPRLIFHNCRLCSHRHYVLANVIHWHWPLKQNCKWQIQSTNCSPSTRCINKRWERKKIVCFAVVSIRIAWGGKHKMAMSCSCHVPGATQTDPTHTTQVRWSRPWM